MEAGAMESLFLFCLGMTGTIGSRLVEFKPTEQAGATFMMVVGILLLAISFFKGEKLGGAE